MKTTKVKQKTRQIVKKRFRLTKAGKVKRLPSNTSHLKRKDTANAKFRKKRHLQVKGKFASKIRKMING